MTQLIGVHSMKKSLLALAALGAFAGAVQAQSSVTLYGIIDAGLTYVNNTKGGSLLAMQSGITQGSRWGLKGSEDLGGGLKTVFQLENGFNTFTGKAGQGGLDFGRQAYVGLSGASWGTVTIGRQYDTIDDYIQPATLNGNWSAYYSHAGDIDNSDNAYRVNNSVKYASPSYNGLTFGGMYAFGGVAGEFGQNSMLGLGAAYANGPIYLTAAYEYARNPATQFTDGNWVATSANPSQFGAFGYVGATPANSQIIGAGGTYTIGAAKVGLDYTNTKFDDANGTASSVTFNNIELWGQYSLTPATTLIAGNTFTFAKTDYTITGVGTTPKWDQFNLMVDYALSKRTDVYIMTAAEEAYGGARASIYNGLLAAPATGRFQAEVRLGIRAKF
jgi:predicted porin